MVRVSYPLSVRAGLTLLLLWSTAAAPSGQSAAKGEWPTYGADLPARATRRSTRSTPSNFDKLEVAWRFKTDNLGPRPEFKLEARR